jgi:hypothetical protein
LLIEGRLSRRLFICAIFETKRFTAHSQNKINGTADIAEHRTSRFVVGAGKQTREEDIP